MNVPNKDTSNITIEKAVRDSGIRETASATALLKDSVEEDSLIRYRLNGAFLKSIFSDATYVVTRPVHWQGRDLRNLGIVMGTAGALLLADKEIKWFAQQNQHPFVNSVANIVEPFGNRYSPYIMAGMYVAGAVIKNRELKNTALLTFKSYAISTSLYLLTKSMIRRNRPAYTDHNLDFYPPFSGDRYHTSFPSGHTLTVMTLATAVSEAYGKQHRWIPWVAYSIAGLTGVSRIYHNRHWSSDVWIGASLGYFVTRSVFKNNRVKKRTGLEFVWR
ncbi:phosphatase PAP2 family protein [Niabella sp. CC-SYL272]|uniref:phosphatase PAP2 family protein n=1 Tax=Niabella agricola TaxID=2891571 RepID=UPI001F48C1A7|nr:phosphatase PAP2 family protein [Niabella agricola]MCF3111453.1 phosphatase PAP2 family protein [Niabella agricola]